MNTDIVKVLTGVRRCGKSVMLQQIKDYLKEQGVDDDNILFYNFDDLSNVHLLDYMKLYNDVQDRLKAVQGRAYIFFDEIQEVEQWERVVNSLRLEETDIYITGSNAHLLSGELATYLAGRYVLIQMYPFSYTEFCVMCKELGKQWDKRQAFQKYVEYGGMPMLGRLSLDKDVSLQYLTDMYSSVVLKDIVQRNKLRDVDLLNRIIYFALDNIGRVFSAAAIVKYLKSEQRKVSNETVLNYMQACVEAFLLYKVPRQDLQGKRLLAINEKYYVVDHGIREAILGRNTRNIDQVLENIVAMEMMRRGFTVHVGKAGEQEVDFVCERGKDRIYIQVCYLLASEDTIKREFGVYKKIRDNFPKYVVSMDEFDFSEDGIQHINICDFLLEQ